MARKRRGRGEGSIYQRSDGTWCATFSVGYSATGGRRRKTVFGDTKQEVQDKLTQDRAATLEGLFVEPNKLRVAAFLDRWLEDGAKPTVRATTYISYQGVVNNHIKSRIGGLMLSKLTPVHVQAMYADMDREGASPRLRQLTHAVLRRALKMAVKWGLVIRNVCDAVDPPRVAKREIATLSAEQVQVLLTAAKDERLFALFVLAIGTGMRMGEMFALHWKNVDLKRATLNVCQTLIELKGKLSLGEPKTAKSRRRIDLPLYAVAALKAHQKKMAGEGFGEVPWVFCNTTGGPLRRSHFHAYVFHPLLEAASLPHMRFHDLRHTSATLLLAAGVHPKIVQERLGHSQIAITLDIYSHVLPTMGLEAAGKLDDVLRPKPIKRKIASPTG